MDASDLRSLLYSISFHKLQSQTNILTVLSLSSLLLHVDYNFQKNHQFFQFEITLRQVNKEKQIQRNFATKKKTSKL